MEKAYKEDFEKYWKQFLTQLRGKMMRQMKSNMYTVQTLNLILDESNSFWDERDFGGCRWLDDYEKQYPQNAKSIRKILLKEMKFVDIENSKSNKEILKYAIPVGGAVVGFVVSGIVKATTIMTAAYTIIPAVVSYPIVNTILTDANAKNKKDALNIYLEQLEQYKLKIEEILAN